MPVPIRRIDSGPPSETRESLERHVAGRIWDALRDRWTDVMVDAKAERISDYWSVEVFVSEITAVDTAERCAEAIQGELRERGIEAYLRVRSWTGPWG
ncbi:MAG: hypothetical protein KBI47_08875 [Armatimonadetes bacterium]|nr:hypothetical protein [Armatimonadota bacterium]MDI9582737.1 hypothetical protein [Acidobacteriota bacterium]